MQCAKIITKQVFTLSEDFGVLAFAFFSEVLKE